MTKKTTTYNFSQTKVASSKVLFCLIKSQKSIHFMTLCDKEKQQIITFCQRC